MSTQTDFAREQMVNQQVRAGAVLDEQVLTTLRAVPRERFVPSAWRELAFADTAIALPAGQRMLPPMIIGRILQALDLSARERVLEVGTGSGYLCACMARHAASVRSLELHAEVADFARANLRATETRGVEVLTTDAYEFTGQGGYDAIVLTGSLPVPDERFQQWLVPGGRMYVVVGSGAIMEALLIERLSADEFRTTTLFETSVPMLEHSRQAAIFHF